MQPGASIPMDCELEAAFGLVYHYSAQFGRLHKKSETNVKVARATAAIVHAHASTQKTLEQRVLSHFF